MAIGIGTTFRYWLEVMSRDSAASAAYAEAVIAPNPPAILDNGREVFSLTSGFFEVGGENESRCR